MKSYKMIYIEYGETQEITATNQEPLQQLLRNLFALHNNYKGSTENFELLFFGEL